MLPFPSITEHFVGCVIVLTGLTDYISDGSSVVALSNGHEMMSKITGSGCIVGSCIASYCAVAMSGSTSLVSPTTLLGAVAGYIFIIHFSAIYFPDMCRSVLVLTIAAEVAAGRHDVQGRGTFLPALIDELSLLRQETVRAGAKIRVIADES